VKFSSVVSIQIFSLKNANPSINEIHVENDYFPLPSKFEMHMLEQHLVYIGKHIHTTKILWYILLDQALNPSFQFKSKNNAYSGA
jgi:hypothetical protein